MTAVAEDAFLSVEKGFVAAQPNAVNFGVSDFTLTQFDEASGHDGHSSVQRLSDHQLLRDQAEGLEYGKVGSDDDGAWDRVWQRWG